MKMKICSLQIHAYFTMPCILDTWTSSTIGVLYSIFIGRKCIIISSNSHYLNERFFSTQNLDQKFLEQLIFWKDILESLEILIFWKDILESKSTFHGPILDKIYDVPMKFAHKLIHGGASAPLPWTSGGPTEAMVLS